VEWAAAGRGVWVWDVGIRGAHRFPQERYGGLGALNRPKRSAARSVRGVEAFLRLASGWTGNLLEKKRRNEVGKELRIRRQREDGEGGKFNLDCAEEEQYSAAPADAARGLLCVRWQTHPASAWVCCASDPGASRSRQAGHLEQGRFVPSCAAACLFVIASSRLC
jgi:hypothetical protein